MTVPEASGLIDRAGPPAQRQREQATPTPVVEAFGRQLRFALCAELSKALLVR